MMRYFRLFRLWRFKFQKTLNQVALPEYTLFSVYAIITGILVGLAAVFFHEAIELCTYIFFESGISHIAFLGAAGVIVLPAIGMFIQSMMIRFSPETAQKKGVSEVIKAVAMRGGYIRLRTTIFHFFAPVINIGSGGTLGPEGPAAQLGGGIASKFAHILGFSDARRRIFTAAGAGAAIAAVFNTPLGGTFFALEIVLLNDFQSVTFSALILAAVSASAISRFFLGNTPTFEFEISAHNLYEQLHYFALLGLAAGILSLLFIRYSNIIDKYFKVSYVRKFPKSFIMVSIGLMVGLAGFFYKEIFGVGYDVINQILANQLHWKIVVIILILKFILVPLVLYSGGFGGLFAPSLFLGAGFGYLFAFTLNSIWGLNLDTTTYVLVGMGASLGGINSIPISAIMIIFEMTREYTFILPLMLAVIISTMMVQLILGGSVHIKHLEEEGFSISSGRETNILRSILVEKIMRRDVVLIPENTPLPQLISQLIQSPHSTFYTVSPKNTLSGAVSESELQPIITEYENLQHMLVASDIAQTNLISVHENEDLDHVLKLFGNANADELPVISSKDNKKVLGTIWRQDVIAAYNRETIKQNLADGIARELKSVDKNYRSQVAEGFSIIERKAPDGFIGKSIAQLGIRNKFGVEILMIKHKQKLFNESNEKEQLDVASANYIIQKGDSLVIFGPDEKLAETDGWA